MAQLPPTSIEIAEFMRLWPDVMPALKDQGEADRMNTLLGNLLDRFRRAGKTIPPMIYLSDAPPSEERQALLDSDGKINPVWFATTYERWWRSPLFKRFWESLSDDEKRQFFEQVPKS